MFPIWATGIVFAAVYAQMSTMFVEQGTVMDTTIGSFTIPAASLSTFDVISVIFWVPIYDRFLVPIARKFTGRLFKYFLISPIHKISNILFYFLLLRFFFKKKVSLVNRKKHYCKQYLG